MTDRPHTLPPPTPHRPVRPLEPSPTVDADTRTVPDDRHEPAGMGQPAPMRRTPPQRPGEPIGHAEKSPPASPDLARFLPATVTGLQARCPHHPRVELALDHDGRLHLLRRHGPLFGSGGVGQAAAQADAAGQSVLQAAVVDLIETRAWAQQHMELLQLTQPHGRFQTDAEPVLHLFTDQARLAAAMVGRIGPFVKLHLLQEIWVGRRSTWFCTGLN